MDYPSNSANGASGSSSMPSGVSDVAENVQAYAQDAVENLNEAVKRGRELVLRYPILSVAGAVAAGYLFAKFARRGR